MDTKMRATALVTLAVALMGSASIAATVNVDFNVSGSPSGHYTGTGAAPDPGTFWNGLTVAPHNSGMTASLSSGSLLASGGTTDTGFTVTMENFNTYDAVNDGQDRSAPFAPALLNDFIWVSDTQLPLTFTVSNLLPGGSYDLYLYSQNGGYNNETTGFTVGGVPQIATNGPGDLSGFVQNGNYVLYSSVIADAGGIITGTSDAAGAPNSAFDGFQIVGPLVPEPASLSLLGLGALLALRRRR